MTWQLLENVEKKWLRDEFTIRPAKLSEYDKLKMFHYITTKRPGGPRFTFGLYYNDICYGVLIYAVTSLELAARKKTILGKLLSHYPNKVKRYKFLNKNTVTISRIVVHPSVRGIGVGAKLIEDTWRTLGVRFVEGFGYMAYFRNFHPKSFSYYIKINRVLKAKDFFDYQSDKGQMIHRAKSPVLKYGYVLYINPDVKVKYAS
jgi:hypothetical protein